MKLKKKILMKFDIKDFNEIKKKDFHEIWLEDLMKFYKKDFHEIWQTLSWNLTSDFFENMSREFKCNYNNGYFTRRPVFVFDNTSLNSS